nr:hypothetical protein [Flavobacteriales bacterium]
MPNLKLNRILKYILVMSAVFSFTISEGQQIFQKEYSGGQVWQQILENDNGYFFAGHKLLLGNYSHQICVYHIDHSGNIIWAKHVGDNFPAGEFVYDYTFSHDSSAILFVGQKKPTASSSYNNTLIFKMDINGNLLWFKLLGDTLNNRSFIIYPFESFYYIGGISYYNLTEDTGGLASILKIDENGSLISEFHYSFNNGTSLGIYGIFRDSSNIYIAGGYRDYLTHNSDILFTILDTSGNLISSKIFGTPMEDYVSSIISDNNGNLIISGNSLGFGNFYRYFTKIDNSGNIM